MIDCCLIKDELKSATLHFTPEGVTVNEMVAAQRAVCAIFKPEYFLSYEVKDNESLEITKTLADRLNMGFKDDKIELHIGEEEGTPRVYIDGSKDHANEKLVKVEEEAFPVPMKVDEKLGVVPQALKAPLQIALSVDEFAGIKADQISFVCKDRKPVMVIGDAVSEFKRDIETKRVEAVEDINVALDGETVLKMIGLFTGEVWFSLTERAGVFSQINKDYLLTYMLTRQIPRAG